MVLMQLLTNILLTIDIIGVLIVIIQFITKTESLDKVFEFIFIGGCVVASALVFILLYRI